MPMNFPDTPAPGDVYSSGGVSWTWTGSTWKAYSLPGAGATVSDGAPSSNVNGNLWWNSTPGDGQLYVRYNDGTSWQWVVANNLGGGLYLALTGGTISPGPLVINANAAAPPAAWTPNSGLQVTAADGAAAGVEVDAFGTGGSPTVNLRLARGTAAAPTATQAFDNLGIINFLGRDTAATGLGAQIIGQTIQNWTTGAHGTELTFLVGALNGTGTPQIAIFRNDTGCQFYGTQTNDNAQAGWVGEYLTTTGGPLTMTNNTFATLCSLSIPAGDWDLWGWFSITNPSGMQMGEGGFATAVNGTPTGPLSLQSLIGGSSFTNFFMPVTQMRVSQASAQSWYLNCACTFGAGTSTCNAIMYARRRR